MSTSELPVPVVKVVHFDGHDVPLLRPNTPFSVNQIKERYAEGTILRAKLTQPRSKPHLDLYWAVLDKVVEATGDRWLSYEDLHTAIKLHLRMVHAISLIEGAVKFEPRSISFSKMDQGEFRLFFKKAMLAIEESTGINTDQVIAEIKRDKGWDYPQAA